ncbi:hypothetical protein BH09SUM1_BH09SUM1_11160 [soil metagenome]
MIRQIAALEASWKALALTAVALLLLGVALLHPSLSDPPVRDAIFSFRPSYSEGTSATLELRQPWRTTASAYVPESSDARILISLPPGPWLSVETELVGPPNQQWAVTVAREAQRRTRPGMRAGDVMRVEGADFPGTIGSQEPVRLEIAPRGAPEPGAELRIIRVRLSATRRELRLPNLAGIIALAAMPLALVGFLTAARRRELWRSAVAGVAFGILLLAIAYHDIRALEFIAPACGVMLLVTAGKRALDAMRKPSTDPERASGFRVAEGFAIAAILVFSLAARWEILLKERSAPLLPDARGYLQIARDGSFYQTAQDHAPWVREPLFPAVLRGWLHVAPDTETSARFASLLIGIVLLFMIWFVGRRAFSPGAALLAAAWAGLNRYLGEISVDVLRDDLMTAVFLALMAVPLYTGCRVWGIGYGKKSRLRVVAPESEGEESPARPHTRFPIPYTQILFGLLGGALALLRINNIALLIPFVGIEAIRRKWKVAEIALVFAIAIPMVAPHLLFNAQYSHGDYFYSSNVHARYYLNREKVGELGYPVSVSEVHRDPYAGEVVTTGYLLRQFSPFELARRIARGYFYIFAFEFPLTNLFSGREWIMAFGLIGAWFAARRWRETWWVIAWFALFLFPIACVAMIGIDSRLATPAAPLILWIWGEGVWRAAELVFERLRPRLGL